MGGVASKPQTSNSKTKKNLIQIVDYVARNFILTQNYTEMKKLADMKYCNDLVILTSNIIAKKLTGKEIKYLSQRVKNGIVTNSIKKENIIYLKKKNLENLDVRNETTKRRMCIAIAKFYVRIAHIFAAIVTTINPVYTYKTPDGNIEHVSLLDIQKLPEGVEKVDEARSKNNLCSIRVNKLLNGHNYDVMKGETIVVNPNFCDMNIDKRTKQSKVLVQEPGIPQLETLYKNIYDMDKGGFTGMDEKMRDGIYREDLNKFYKSFTGKSDMPKDENGKSKIKSFGDIPLKDYHASTGCIGDPSTRQIPLYRREYKGKKQGLFEKYATHIKNMMTTTNSNRNKLIEIVDSIFVYGVDESTPQSKKYSIIINPKLTEDKLVELTDETRNIIVSLYLTCENDFAKGVNIFEAIVAKNELDNNKQYVASLKKDLDSTIEKKQKQVETSEKTEAKYDTLRLSRRKLNYLKNIQLDVDTKIKKYIEKHGDKSSDTDDLEILKKKKENIDKMIDSEVKNIAVLEKKPVQEFESVDPSSKESEPTAKDEEDRFIKETIAKFGKIDKENKETLHNLGKDIGDISSRIKDSVLKIGEVPMRPAAAAAAAPAPAAVPAPAAPAAVHSTGAYKVKDSVMDDPVLDIKESVDSVDKAISRANKKYLDE